ncbi:MAG TPA: hypothetical protein VKV27_04110 [Solirubrobacteraceae bacterium]|nr:hypothetical protein [Solirubrobacteraceae bacterium]
MAHDRIDRAVFATSVVLVGFGYSLLLPYAYTQRISLANWSFLDTRYVAFTVAFAVGLAWLITLQVHAVRRVARVAAGERLARRTGPAGALAAVVSVLPSLLCCSPILPTLIGVIGLSATARLSTTVQLQHFFATEENPLLLGALSLLLLSCLWSMRKLARASCLEGECCASLPEDAHRMVEPSAAARRMTPAGASAGGED